MSNTSDLRQKMLDQVPSYRERLAALEAAGLKRPANQDALAQAQQAMAAMDSKFTPDRFRNMGSLVRRLERELAREQNDPGLVGVARTTEPIDYSKRRTRLPYSPPWKCVPYPTNGRLRVPQAPDAN